MGKRTEYDENCTMCSGQVLKGKSKNDAQSKCKCKSVKVPLLIDVPQKPQKQGGVTCNRKSDDARTPLVTILR